MKSVVCWKQVSWLDVKVYTCVRKPSRLLWLAIRIFKVGFHMKKTVACMTGALWARRGERDISRGARHERGAQHEREARDEGKRKIKLYLLLLYCFYFCFCFIFLFPSSRASRSCGAPREISRSPRLAHKAPVMQAKKTVSKSQYVYNITPVSPGCSSLLIDQKNIFLANQKQAIQTFLELVQ